VESREKEVEEGKQRQQQLEKAVQVAATQVVQVQKERDKLQEQLAVIVGGKIHRVRGKGVTEVLLLRVQPKLCLA
jgi:hypothetical protein